MHRASGTSFDAERGCVELQQGRGWDPPSLGSAQERTADGLSAIRAIDVER